jgi:hypothetical protein
MSQPPPSLQTVATLTGGTSPVMQQAFFWGIPGRPFSVGTHGDWVVNGPGVEPLHFFLNFDGRMILVASGPSGASVTISGVPVDHNWRAVPVFAEIAFGGARIRVTCEDAPQPAPMPQAPPPAPPMPQAPPPQASAPANPASFAAPVHTPQTLDRTAYLRPRQLKTEPLALTPEQVAYVQTAAAPLQVSDSAAPRPYTPEPPAQFPATGAPGGTLPPALAPTVHSPAPPAVPHTVHASPPPGLNATTRSAAPPPGVMPPGRSFSPPQVTIPAGHGSAPPPPAAAPLGTPVPSTGEDNDAAGVSTLSDAGALRALADRVQTDPAASQAHAAYFAEVQRAWVEQSIPPAAGAPPPPPRLASSAPPARVRQNAPSNEPDLAGEKPKEKTSWVMRLVMLLLPVAGYFAIFWEPPASAPAPAEDESAEAKVTATSTAAPSASARVPATPSAAVVTAAPPALGAAPSSSGPLVLPSSAGPIVAPAPAASVAMTERPDKGTPKAGASAPAPPSASPIPTRLAQQALNAAFEGRLSEAAERYERLAAGPDGEAYRVSARLIRDRAIRKP